MLWEVDESPKSKTHRQSWAALLRRVYELDGEACPRCGAKMRPIGAVTDEAEARAFLGEVRAVARGPPSQMLLPLSA